MEFAGIELFRISVSDNGMVVLDLSFWLLAAIVLTGIAFLFKSIWARNRFRHFDLVNVDIELGNIGKVSFKPNTEDIQIAHQVWTELITRKAAIPIDEENDVIIEIYDSWYTLFGIVRQLIGSIPGQFIRKEKSTQKIVCITIEALNIGLRPHLTEWQATFRNWYNQNESRLEHISPQELQREFPEYQALIADMKDVNRKMIHYAAELHKIVHGE